MGRVHRDSEMGLVIECKTTIVMHEEKMEADAHARIREASPVQG